MGQMFFELVDRLTHTCLKNNWIILTLDLINKK